MAEKYQDSENAINCWWWIVRRAP